MVVLGLDLPEGLELVRNGTRHHLVEQCVGTAFLERQFVRLDPNTVSVLRHVTDHLVRSVGVPAGQGQADNGHDAHCRRVADQSITF